MIPGKPVPRIKKPRSTSAKIGAGLPWAVEPGQKQTADSRPELTIPGIEKRGIAKEPLVKFLDSGSVEYPVISFLLGDEVCESLREHGGSMVLSKTENVLNLQFSPLAGRSINLMVENRNVLDVLQKMKKAMVISEEFFDLLRKFFEGENNGPVTIKIVSPDQLARARENGMSEPLICIDAGKYGEVIKFYSQ